MKGETESKDLRILPVPRTKREAKRVYDRISRYYDYLTAASERNAERALDRLSIVEGETVLEIGFGNGALPKADSRIYRPNRQSSWYRYFSSHDRDNEEKIGKSWAYKES